MSPIHLNTVPKEGLEMRESCDILRTRGPPQRGFWEDLSAMSGAQLVEGLPGMREAPGSILSAT